MFRSSRDVGSLPAKKVVNKTWEVSYNQELYGCDICSDGGWTSETEVEIHKNNVHYRSVFMRKLRKRNDYCYICIKKCENQEAVIKHIKAEHLLSTENCMRVEREIFICNTCSAIFFNKENLVIHLRYSHLNMKNMSIIKCLMCLKNILVRNIPAHFYMHNIQSVSTCRICLMKCENTKTLKEHLKIHPYYLKCDMCYYETSKVESFHNHILLKHKIDPLKVEYSMTDVVSDKKPIKDEPVTDQTIISGNYVNSMTDNVSNIEEDDDDFDDTVIDDDSMTIIEVIDPDDVTDNVMYLNNFMTKSVKGNTIKKKKLKGFKKRNKKNRQGASESVLAVENLMKDAAMTVTDETDVSTDKNLSTVDTFRDSDIFTVKDSTTDNDNRGFLTDKVITSESIKEENMITYDSISENNLLTVKEVIDKTTDVMTNEDSGDNLMTVNEISENHSTVEGTNLTENVKIRKQTARNFKRFFIPETPAFLRFQRIAGFRGVRLSNDVRVCILCREVCVGLKEMRSHINEHTVRQEKINSYYCSCGEQFTNRVLLKHHAFKSKHVIGLTYNDIIPKALEGSEFDISGENSNHNPEFILPEPIRRSNDH